MGRSELDRKMQGREVRRKSIDGEEEMAGEKSSKGKRGFYTQVKRENFSKVLKEL